MRTRFVRIPLLALMGIGLLAAAAGCGVNELVAPAAAGTDSGASSSSSTTGVGGVGGTLTGSGGGDAGGAAGGSGGGGPMCLPGSETPYYTGPPGTESIGIGHGGTKTCDKTGADYGPCLGEVTPIVENCATIDDDDCDGLANEPSAGCVCSPNASVPC